MTIEQIIKYLPAPICGDTALGKEKQKEYDAHDSAVIILRKYQKIEQIVNEYNLQLCDNTSDGAYNFQRIKEVVDGKID